MSEMSAPQVSRELSRRKFAMLAAAVNLTIYALLIAIVLQQWTIFAGGLALSYIYFRVGTWFWTVYDTANFKWPIKLLIAIGAVTSIFAAPGILLSLHYWDGKTISV